MATGDDQAESMALHVRIRGRVQGVFFRRWVADEATRRGLRGWVRNRADGSVEAVFSGDMDTVRAMARACHHGPPRARVSQVIQIPGEYRPTADDFSETFKILPSI